MPPRDAPTARQARLGSELRRMRERAGRTAREAGALLGTDQAKISMMEAGRRGVSEERVRRLAAFYACEDAALVDALCGITHEHRGQFWWDAYRGALPPSHLDVAELEHHATRLRSVQMLLVPGIFQTPDYARAIFGSGTPATELEARVELRTSRAAVLDRQNPPPYEVIIHEAALRMRYGGRQVARAQLERLLEASEKPSVDVRVIPFAVEEMSGHAQSMLYAAGAVPRLDTVQIDTPFGGGFVDTEPQLKKYNGLIDALEDVALDTKESRDMVRRVAREM
ncbi:helix-turn-helix domain-containing protein [Streptomyces albireticuli]|uniref:Transcriptional regulator n=1 Tax=Streptomyces albireticuli TaxID=1940 RepID=A0A2A2D4P2_9ACTN|nr:helix-turn-helix transcriptional regulator [Streptomyces albireticuli]MCD9144241.1 helix-turn-helix domain-containing protein [Streptomyces albireticuli]MCD9162116.1 helix-turn-helix domain-containing protein [Streptomyces albireticuli]MCD9193878.1 helix-turn-helix domain-containing protein [Streptomyces albireticuli]PAU46300.1 transcriptional regulator [Streptomyces albireticuli]